MSGIQLERISNFRGWSEYEKFERWLSEHVASGALEEVSRPPALDIGLRSRHFLLPPEGEVWELLEPDPPFAGSFKPYEVREEFGV